MIENREIAAERVSEILKEISIPPRPDLLVKFMQVKESNNVDLRRIAEICNSDPAVSVGLLKTVNSPFFGLAKLIASVPHAVMLLGLNNVSNIVSGICLRKAFEQYSTPFIEAVWSRSMELALLSARVAGQFTPIPPDEAYVVGMLANCGVPLMAQTFSNYEASYRERLERQDATIREVEEAEFAISHVELGAMVAEDWQFPEFIPNTILRHHDRENIYAADPDRSQKTTQVMAVLKIAEHLSAAHHGEPDLAEWETLRTDILAYMAIDEPTLLELEAHCSELLNQLD